MGRRSERRRRTHASFASEMAQPLASMKSAPAFLPASGHDHAADERNASGPSQSMQVRTLGWHIPDSAAEDLFSRLYAAVASIGTMELSGDSDSFAVGGAEPDARRPPRVHPPRERRHLRLPQLLPQGAAGDGSLHGMA